MPHRRWFQFSTRGLLLLLTAVCAWLGYLTEAARRQRDAVAVLAPAAAIGYDDGSILSGPFWEDKAPSGPRRWLKECIGKEYVADVDTIVLFSEARITREHLKAINVLRSAHTLFLGNNESVDDLLLRQIDGRCRVRQLHLCNTLITDATLQYIASLSRLELFCIDDTYIDGSGFRFLRASPSLSYISLRDSEVTDEHLDDLGACHHLRYVDLRNTHVTADGVARLQQALPHCEIRWRD